jgi:hypothetical protein
MEEDDRYESVRRAALELLERGFHLGGYRLNQYDLHERQGVRPFSVTCDGRSTVYLEARREGDIWRAAFGGAAATQP